MSALGLIMGNVEPQGGLIRTYQMPRSIRVLSIPLTLVGSLLSAAILAGCDTQTPEEQAREELVEVREALSDPDKDLGEEAAEAFEAAGDALVEGEHRDFGDRIDDGLDKLEARMKAVRQDAKRTRVDTRQQLDADMAEAEAELQRIREDMKDLGDDADQAWDQSAERLAERAEDLHDRVEAMNARVNDELGL